MPWFNVDDGFHCHPKVLAAGNAAMGLWARLGSYCARYATDGVIPAEIVRNYGTKTEVKTLVEIGWLRQENGRYRMHDYLDYNRTADQITADRARAAERKRRQRERDSHGVTSPVTPTVTDAVSHTPQSNPIQSKRITLENNSHHPHGSETTMDERIEAIANAILEWRITIGNLAIGNRTKYAQKAIPDIVAQHGERCRELVAKFPFAPVDSIVHALETGETRNLAMFAGDRIADDWRREPDGSNVVDMPARKLTRTERVAALRDNGAPVRFVDPGTNPL